MIRTGGGKFDPADRYIYFSAGGTSGQLPHNFLVAVNDLPSRGYERHLEQWLEQGHSIFLDSGIFNLTNEHKRNHGGTMDEALSLAPEAIDGFHELYDKYVTIVSKFGDDLWGYIELDQGGMDHKRRTRKRLHDEGLSPIPVYHPLNDGWDYFDELANNYDRICFGNMVQANLATRTRLLHTLWERHRAYPDLWVHVLGMTASEFSLTTPPDSSDSSTWVNGMRYPKVDMGYANMRRQGFADHEFLYVPGHPVRTDQAASMVYRDEVEYVNKLWRQILADERDTFGKIDYPEPDPAERMDSPEPVEGGTR